MKKIITLALSLFLIFSSAFSNVAFAKKVFGDFTSYGNDVALLLNSGEKFLLTEISPDASIKTFAFQNIILCTFQPGYFAFISDHEGSEQYYIWPFQGTESMIGLGDYTPIFFDEYEITVKKGDTYYEIDMDKAISAGELVAHPID